MYIQLKDHTGKIHRVPAEGAIFGRDRTRCDVVLPDIGVSGVHAKIYWRQGRWFLEDLHSSNGTFLGEKRVNGPVELARGAAFGLFRWRFEVTDISSTSTDAIIPELTDGSKTSALDMPSISRQPDSQSRRDVARAAAIKHIPTEVQPSIKVNAAPASAPITGAPSSDAVFANISDEKIATVRKATINEVAISKPITQPSPAVTKETSALTVQEVQSITIDDTVASFKDELSQFQLPRLFAGIKAAIAYYFMAIPKLAVRPFAFVRASIDNPQHEAMRAVDIVGWAIPATLISSLAPLVASLILSVVHGHLNIVNQVVISPLIAIISAIIASIIIGFLWHPLLHWFVAKLGGQSTALLRSNMFVTCYSAVPLISIASAVGIIVTLAPLQALNLVGPLLSILAVGIVILVSYRWYQKFEVAKWFLIVILVLGAASTFSHVRSIVGVSQATIAQIRYRSSNKVAINTNNASSNKVSNINTEKTATSVSSGKNEVAVIKATNSSANNSVQTIATKPLTQIAVKQNAVASKLNTASTYLQYIAKRESIEKTIAEDPTLLKYNSKLLNLYRKLHSENNRINDMFFSKGKNKADDIVAMRLRDAEVYETTVNIVDEIALILQQ
ncbi:MAG: FHA domain-containing protein [Deltaproteobacteria bacterium]|nr:FHA domain-containing protein [Deltaproteobacteria bacterium]